MRAVFLLFLLLCHRRCAAAKDIHWRDGVISYGQCQRLLQQQYEQSIHSIDKQSQESKDLYPVFHNSIELYLEQGNFDPYPPIQKDTGYVYYRFCDANTTRLSIPPLGTYVGAILFLNDNEWNGGDWLFPRQNVTVKPRCGRMLMFPTCFTHPHMMNPVRKDAFVEFIATWFL